MSDLHTTNPAENRIGAIEVGKRIWDGAASAAGWVGGALAGEFSQKQTTGQIIFDAVISMFPLLGEGTAARDSIAICISMCEDHRKAEDHWEWVKLVLCLIAVVPIVGGVLKGVGKLVMRALDKAEDLEKLATEIVRFANRMGQGSAYQWLRQLDFVQYQGKVLAAVGEFLDRFTRACQYIVKNMAGLLPQGVVQYLSLLPPRLQNIGKLANRMVPQALRDLNACLFRVRAHLVEGTFADILVGSGTVTTREAEGRLAHTAQVANRIPHPKATVDQFQPKEGWPNLKEKRFATFDDDGVPTYSKIESFSRSAPIVAKTLAPGEIHIFRVIDPSKPSWTKSGEYWLPRMPKRGMEWRELWAVLFSWNRNGGYVELTRIPTAEELAARGMQVPSDWSGLRAWSGLVSSQLDEKLGRYWAGGETQLFIDFKHPHNEVLLEYVRALVTQRTGWTDVNVAAVLKAVVTPMERDETAAKTVPQGYTKRLPVAASDDGSGKTTSQH